MMGDQSAHGVSVISSRSAMTSVGGEGKRQRSMSHEAAMTQARSHKSCC